MAEFLFFYARKFLDEDESFRCNNDGKVCMFSGKDCNYPLCKLGITRKFGEVLEKGGIIDNKEVTEIPINCQNRFKVKP